MPPEVRKTTDGREQRFLRMESARVSSRAAENSPGVIEGYAALFNEETVIGSWFRERILPGAFKDSLANDDIRVAFNHSPNAILGRTSAKTARLSEDEQGLRYEADAPDTQAGRDTVTSIKRGDITGSSFQFEVENDADEEWDFSQTKQGKLPLRTIKRAKLWEGGPVAWPAYEKTTVSARAMAHIEEARAAVAAAAAAPAVPVVPTASADSSATAPATPIAEPRATEAAPVDPVDAARRAALDALEAQINSLDID
jgi:uncharacterized protein